MTEEEGYLAFFRALDSQWLNHLYQVPADTAIKAFFPHANEALIQFPSSEDPGRAAWKRGWTAALREFDSESENHGA